ncbi:MAG: PBP1A family penicillin-binding protein [Acidobacteriota bacterium]|nr:PBP1A family penicillin-binding protein [Acidobacteriota bacterium]
MATAIVRLDKSPRIKGFPKSRKNAFKKAAPAAIVADNRRSAFKKWFFNLSFAALFFTALAATGFYYFYSQAAAAVEQRIRLGFWQTRSGIYAAPHVLRIGQKIKTEELVAILRHSGYVEGENRNIWNGNFTVKGDTVAIQTNHPAGEQPEIISVEIAQGRIAKIKNGNNPIEAHELQPEMISGKSEARRDSINPLKFEQIPEILRNAIIVTEDRRFFEHGGVDPRGVFRAFYRNVSGNEIKQGGSTITQQFVKNVFLTNEKSFGRKFSEAFLALALEKNLSKEDIFALYCNEIYLGQYGAIGIHGVEQASRGYFGKKIENLSVAEAALLAAMIKSPHKYSPAHNYEAAKERRNLVIQKLLEEGLILQADAEKAKAEEIVLAAPPKRDKSAAPYFVDAVLREISDDRLPESNLRIYTTIDPQLQEMAENSINKELAKLDKAFAKKGATPQAALVAINPKNGHVLAMVGGRDYAASQLNRATEARRQPGSTFKPFVYATALEQGKLPTSIVDDRPTAFAVDRKPYQPANYGNSYAMHEITLKTALAKSSNVAAVETALESGLHKVAATAEKFGMKRPEAYPSMALGTEEVTPLELAAAYAAFANDGKRVDPVFVSQIVSGEGNLVYKNADKDEQVVSPQTAYMITDMLSAVVERGTARAAKGALGKDVAFVGKTGSSKDGWFVGYTPNLVCVVWIGFDDTEDIGFTGGEIALPVWVDFMKKATEARPEFGGSSFSMPKGLVEVTIDPETGMLADEYCPQREKVVLPSKSFSNLECLRHQPKPDVLYAAQTPAGVETFAPEDYETIQIEIETRKEPPAAEQYKSINGVPVTRGLKKEKIKIESRDDFDSDEEIRDSAAEESNDSRKPQRTTVRGADGK